MHERSKFCSAPFQPTRFMLKTANIFDLCTRQINKSVLSPKMGENKQ